MAPSELIEAPGDFTIPALDGPVTEAEEVDLGFPDQPHSIMEELPAPLEE